MVCFTELKIAVQPSENSFTVPAQVVLIAVIITRRGLGEGGGMSGDGGGGGGGAQGMVEW